jgi:hypothetical protein
MRETTPFAAAASFLLIVGFFAFLCSTLQGCGGVDVLPQLCEEPEVDATSAYIIEGRLSEDTRSTVSLGSCSGTIVGPHTVLTAAHCENVHTVYPEGWPFPSARIVEQLPHPKAWGVGRHDLRLVYVEEELSPVASVAAYQGCTSLLVQGYGRTEEGEYGTLYERTVAQLWRGHGILMTGEATCNGDSGGPLYALQEDGTYSVVAVTSFGTVEGCIDQDSGFADLTQHGNAEWVLENIR